MANTTVSNRFRYIFIAIGHPILCQSRPINPVMPQSSDPRWMPVHGRPLVYWNNRFWCWWPKAGIIGGKQSGDAVQVLGQALAELLQTALLLVQFLHCPAALIAFYMTTRS